MNQATWYLIARDKYQIPAVQCWMVHYQTPSLCAIHTPNIGPIDVGFGSISSWTNRCRIGLNIRYLISPIGPGEENQAAWHYIGWHYYWIAGAQWRMIHFRAQESLLSALQILDPSWKDWYQFKILYITHRPWLGESSHLTYHKAALLPNRRGPWRMVHFGTQVSVLSTSTILDP